MTELKPWIEDGAPEAVAHLLEAARVEQPSNESLTRSLAAVGVGVVTASTASTAGAAGASAVLGTKASMLLGTAGALKWIMIGAGLGAAVVAAIAENRVPNRPVPTSLGARPLPSAHSLAPLASSRFGAATPGVLAETPRAEATSIAPERSKSVTSPATLDKPRPEAPAGLRAVIDSERLSEEIRAIDSANQALASGRTAQALTALDDYDRRYPEHRFAPEALYLRMEALVRSGRAGEARAIAKRLATTYPNSPQSARARVVLSEMIP
jgi:hypothetical protein